MNEPAVSGYNVIQGGERAGEALVTSSRKDLLAAFVECLKRLCTQAGQPTFKSFVSIKKESVKTAKQQIFTLSISSR
jgi:hypothetical protein